MKKLNKIYKSIIYERNEYIHKEYLKWKRKNVTLRGMNDRYSENGGGAMLGDGLYTAPLGNKVLAKSYGKVYFVLNAIPKTPLVVNSLNDWEIWSQRNLFGMFSTDNYPNQREFFKNTNIKDEMVKLGYDGIIIKGREIVNFTPSDNDLSYFENERQLQMYYEDMIIN
jgi:hypothetical protein